MLHELVQKRNGKEKVVMTDTLVKVNARKKLLANSLRGEKVTFSVRPTETNVKNKKKPCDKRRWQ